MHLLNKAQALRLVDEQAGVLDAPGNPVNPFATSVWLRHFLDEVATPEWPVACLQQDGALMLLHPTQAHPPRLALPTNYYASLASPMACRSADRQAAMDALLQGLTALRPRVATVNFAPLDEEAADTAMLARGLRAHGWYVRRYFCFGNWFMPCEGLSFDDYMAGRDSQLRNTHARKAKKLLAAGSVEVVTRPEDVDAAMDAYDLVYAKSWKQAEPYPNFVRQWARRCAEQGWLRLGVARLGDVPIAAQFWFTIQRRAYIYKLAYDEDHAKWSAGTVLTATLMRQALDEDRVVEVDYLTGDDPYKKTWMNHRRERIGLMACNTHSVAGLGAAAAEFAGATRARWRARARPVAA